MRPWSQRCWRWRSRASPPVASATGSIFGSCYLPAISQAAPSAPGCATGRFRAAGPRPDLGQPSLSAPDLRKFRRAARSRQGRRRRRASALHCKIILDLRAGKGAVLRGLRFSRMTTPWRSSKNTVSGFARGWLEPPGAQRFAGPRPLASKPLRRALRRGEICRKPKDCNYSVQPVGIESTASIEAARVLFILDEFHFSTKRATTSGLVSPNPKVRTMPRRAVLRTSDSQEILETYGSSVAKKFGSSPTKVPGKIKRTSEPPHERVGRRRYGW